MTLQSSTTGRPINRKPRSASITAPSVPGSPAPARPSSTTTPRRPAAASPHSHADRALQELLNRLPGEKVRCLDVETSGLDWKTNAIVGYVLSFSGDPRDSYYVPFRHAGTANVGGREGLRVPDDQSAALPGERELIKELNRLGTVVFGHKIAFDLKFASRAGLKLNADRYEDTAINDTLIDEFAGSYDLEDCAQRRRVQHKKSDQIKAHIEAKFPEVKKNHMAHYWRLAGDDPVAVEYARGDGTTTWQLRDAQTKLITEQKEWRGRPVPTLELVHDVESRLIPVLVRMMLKGVRVDEQRLDWIDGEITRRLEAMYAKLPPDFNSRSPKDVRAWIEGNGVTDWPTTAPSARFPHGQPSFRKDWLEKSDAGRLVTEPRKYETLRSSFYGPLRDNHIHRGRVHTTFNQLKFDDFGTVTGRLSSNDPNMQAVPKHDEDTGRLFRSAFVPDPGKIWGAVDYSQCEPRLLAFYTRCRVLLDDYRNNPDADAHMAVTLACNKGKNLSPDEIRKYRNNYGKRVNQTLITGGGKKVLTTKYGIPPREVDRIWSDYFRAMPEIRPFQKRCAATFKQRGYVWSLLGRRMHLNDDRDYTALNRLLQGGNADIIKTKLVEVGEYLASLGDDPGVDLLLNCHDALDFQFDEAARPVYDRCREILQDFNSDGATIRLDLPMPVDAGEGPNWAIASYGEDKVK